jgi:hypothetical protein
LSIATNIVRKPTPKVNRTSVLPPISVAVGELLVLLWPVDEAAVVEFGFEELEFVVKFTSAGAVLSQNSHTV